MWSTQSYVVMESIYKKLRTEEPENISGLTGTWTLTLGWPNARHYPIELSKFKPVGQQANCEFVTHLIFSNFPIRISHISSTNVPVFLVASGTAFSINMHPTGKQTRPRPFTYFSPNSRVSRIYRLEETFLVATSFLGGSGVMPQRKFFEMNTRWDAVWCILKHTFEIMLLIYCNDDKLFLGGSFYPSNTLDRTLNRKIYWFTAG